MIDYANRDATNNPGMMDFLNNKIPEIIKCNTGKTKIKSNWSLEVDIYFAEKKIKENLHEWRKKYGFLESNYETKAKGKAI